MGAHAELRPGGQPNAAITITNDTRTLVTQQAIRNRRKMCRLQSAD